MQQAPKTGTIVFAAVLTAFAAVALFLDVLPATILGQPTPTLGIYAAIVAFVVLLIGVFVDGI
jgi:hypothetical protein